MSKKLKSRLLKFFALPLLVIASWYSPSLPLFEYTLVADIREMFSDVDRQEPLAYGEVIV